MRILWFNWRDIMHPDAGGAEVLTHEVMKRLVKRGYDVTLFCPKVADRMLNEEIDGVNIVRNGGKYTTYNRGQSYFKKNRNKYDIVIDEVNPKPFLNPKILNDKPVLVLFHQFIREEWFYEMPFPLNYFCYFYENKWISPYRETPTLTVSPSSKNDLENIGFQDIKVIPMGISAEPLDVVGRKEDIPTLAFVGRLKRHKLPDHAVRAFQIMKKHIPTARMWIIGNGPMLGELQKMDYNDVTFFGHVDNREKNDLLSRAHLVLVPSVREGWGLVVTEANAMGTPVVAYDVNGLRDSVIDGKNGFLDKEKSPESLARLGLELLTNTKLLKKLSSDALEYSRQFSWDKTTDYVASQIEKVL